MRASRRDRVKVVILSGAIVLLMGFPLAPKVEYLPVGDLGKPAPNSSPSLCLGFNATEDSWGPKLNVCPANYALNGADDPAGVAGPAEKIAARMNCCPLPSNDILLDEHVFTPDKCPEDAVATGMQKSKAADGATYLMRCSKINTSRYQLGASRPGAYWGTGAAGWKGATRIAWSNIPAAIRYAHGRQSKEKWDVDGCVGYPFGSLLSEKETKYCAGMFFRQLQFKGAAGDPAEGTAVQMFPDCEEVTNINDPQKATCVKKIS